MEDSLNNMVGTGARGIGILATGDVLVSMIYETRFAIGLLFILVIADFHFGWSESRKRYAEAKNAGDKRRMDLYKWRTSRAVRKSTNKLVDYIIIMAIGMAIGMAILEPVGINHIFGAFGASLVMALCEISSIFGHFFYLRDVKVEKKNITGFMKAFAVAIIKKKNSDMGEALEETFNNQNK